MLPTLHTPRADNNGWMLAGLQPSQHIIIASTTFKNCPGPAVYLHKSAYNGINVTFVNCIFDNNAGSAVLVADSTSYPINDYEKVPHTVSFIDCYFTNNKNPSSGGAVMLRNTMDSYSYLPMSNFAPITFKKCTFKFNEAGRWGGAIAAFGSSYGYTDYTTG